MISNRRGIVQITRYLYESNQIDNALFGLRIKVYDVSYEPFTDTYLIHFTSPFCREVEESAMTPTYHIIVDNGFRLEEL